MSSDTVQVEFHITESEHLALQSVMLDVTDWAENAVTQVAKTAGDEIIIKLINHCNLNDVQMAVGRANQIQQAYDLGIVQTVNETNAELESVYGPE